MELLSVNSMKDLASYFGMLNITLSKFLLLILIRQTIAYINRYWFITIILQFVIQ